MSDEIKKISDWLEAHIGSHDIANALTLRDSFIAECGCVPLHWPMHTVKETRERIAGDVRGGSVTGADEAKVVYGYELAASLAYDYADKFRSTAMGRGFAYRHCVEALRAAGK